MAATPSSNLGFQNFFQATLTGDITASSTDIPMDNIPNSTEGFLVIEPDSTTKREVIFYNSKTALKVVCPSAADGRGQDDTTATTHSTGATVIMAPVAAFWEAFQQGLAFADNVINFGKMLGGSEILHDYIASGGAVAQSSGLIGTFSNIVYYIGGKRYTASSVANKTYTASKDTYVDIGIDGTVDYNEVANGAAAPALASNHVRVAKVVTNGSAITSVVQSHVDSLGNLIYPEKIGTKRTDANGWTVYNMGSYREYRKTVTWSQAFTSGSLVSLSLSSNNLPVGMSSLGTTVMATAHWGNGNSGDVLVVPEMNTGSTGLSYVAKTTGTATYSGRIHITLTTV